MKLALCVDLIKTPSSVFLYLDRTERARGEKREESRAVIPVAYDIIARSKHRNGNTLSFENEVLLGK